MPPQTPMPALRLADAVMLVPCLGPWRPTIQPYS